MLRTSEVTYFRSVSFKDIIMLARSVLKTGKQATMGVRAMSKFVLPDLDYGFGDLAPSISGILLYTHPPPTRERMGRFDRYA